MLRISHSTTPAGFNLVTPEQNRYQTIQPPHIVPTHCFHSIGSLTATYGLKWAARVDEDRQRIQLRRRELHDRRRQSTQACLNATWHVFRRNLVDQANDLLLCSACKFAVGDTTDPIAGGAQRVEIILPHISTQQHGIHPIHSDEVIGYVCEGKGMLAVVPFIWEPFSSRELEFWGRGACIRLHSTEKRANVLQVRGCGVATLEIWEEPE